MDRIVNIIGPVLVGALVGCGAATETKTIHVSHYREPCVGVGTQLCYVTDEEGARYGIDGWSFEWGYEYTLEVEIEEVEDPPADGSSKQYTLISEIAKERVVAGTSFSIPVFDQEIVVEGPAGSYSIFGERAFDCAANSLCGDLASAMQNAAPCVELQLSHPAAQDEPLLLEAIRPYSGGWGC